MEILKFRIVLNARRQLESDIGYCVVAWMPQRKFVVAARILVSDFELFIGGRSQKKRQLSQAVRLFNYSPLPLQKHRSNAVFTDTTTLIRFRPKK